MSAQKRKALKSMKSYQALAKHFLDISKIHMKELFSSDPKRGQHFFLESGGIKLDFSKNKITQETLELLIDLANECSLKSAIEAMFSAEKINNTENRAVLHVALRNRANEPIHLDGSDVMPGVNSVLKRMAHFADAIRSGTHLGYTNQMITDIVNIGVGGSDAGALMACSALKAYANPKLKVHFVSNVDGSQISDVLRSVHPETTLFIIASKTFSTQETLTNALSAREWFLSHCGSSDHIARHFVAVSTNKSAVDAFGIDTDHMFEFWNWVGGRYSLWSSIGLPIMIYLGKENFYELLLGAHEMDLHFKNAPFHENLPVILALLGVWYINFFESRGHVITPYDQELRFFIKFLQQLDMESNGKQIAKDGTKVDYLTSPMIWGELGINAQHAFFQMLHQGTHLIPIDFIASLKKGGDKHHEILLANMFAQSQAFMQGRTYEQALDDLDSKKAHLAPHKFFSGDRPSNVILLERICPRNLGALIALYEHKIFVQGVIWDINSFDQWGVELGKELTGEILKDLSSDSKECSITHDSSTSHLIKLYKDFNQHKEYRNE